MHYKTNGKENHRCFVQFWRIAQRAGVTAHVLRRQLDDGNLHASRDVRASGLLDHIAHFYRSLHGCVVGLQTLTHPPA